MSEKVLERFTAVVNNLGTAAANWGKRESSQNADQWDAASRAVTKEFMDLQRQLDEARALVDQLRLGRNEELAECQSELSTLKGAVIDGGGQFMLLRDKLRLEALERKALERKAIGNG